MRTESVDTAWSYYGVAAFVQKQLLQRGKAATKAVKNDDIQRFDCTLVQQSSKFIKQPGARQTMQHLYEPWLSERTKQEEGHGIGERRRCTTVQKYWPNTTKMDA